MSNSIKYSKGLLFLVVLSLGMTLGDSPAIPTDYFNFIFITFIGDILYENFLPEIIKATEEDEEGYREERL